MRQSFPITQRTTVIGSGPGAEIALPPSAPSVLAQIVYDGSGFAIVPDAKAWTELGANRLSPSSPHAMGDSAFLKWPGLTGWFFKALPGDAIATGESRAVIGKILKALNTPNADTIASAFKTESHPFAVAAQLIEQGTLTLDRWQRTLEFLGDDNARRKLLGR
jgi:hypothetical protein